MFKKTPAELAPEQALVRQARREKFVTTAKFVGVYIVLPIAATFAGEMAANAIDRRFNKNDEETEEQED